MAVRKESPEDKAFDASEHEAHSVHAEKYQGIAYVTHQMNLLISSLIVTSLMESANMVRAAFDSEGFVTEDSLSMLHDADACLKAADKYLKELTGTFGKGSMRLRENRRDSGVDPGSALLSALSTGDTEGEPGFLAFLVNMAREGVKESFRDLGIDPESAKGETLIGMDITTVHDNPKIHGYVDNYYPDSDQYKIHCLDGTHHVLNRKDFTIDSL